MSNVQMVMMRTGRWAFSDPLVDLKSYCEVHNIHYMIHKDDKFQYHVDLRIGTEDEVNGFPSAFLCDAIYQALWTDWEFNVGRKCGEIAEVVDGG